MGRQPARSRRGSPTRRFGRSRPWRSWRRFWRQARTWSRDWLAYGPCRSIVASVLTYASDLHMAFACECKQCAVLWPEGWTRCPACKTMTQITHRKPERTQSEARTADFERRYVEREERRISEGHLAPEGIGRREAREIIELERRLADEAA